MGYPVLSRRSVIDCPVHGVTVALNGEGRVASRCPGCRLEVRRALDRWRKRQARRLAVV